METLIDVKHAFHLLCPDREELIKRLRKRAFCSRRRQALKIVLVLELELVLDC
jgi:hypothetical protein